MWMFSKEMSRSSEFLFKKQPELVSSRSRDSLHKELPKEKSSNILHEIVISVPAEPTVINVETFLQDSIQNNTVSPTTDEPALEETEELIRKRRQLSKGVNIFNIDSNKGMALLLSNKCISNEPKEVAKFLHGEKRLSKTKIGEYLGGGFHFKILILLGTTFKTRC
jgi:Sec7-like guanine-nucleotide exchange factor